eukprot:144604-Amphidinium_carterae.1
MEEIHELMHCMHDDVVYSCNGLPRGCLTSVFASHAASLLKGEDSDTSSRSRTIARAGRVPHWGLVHFRVGQGLFRVAWPRTGGCLE